VTQRRRVLLALLITAACQSSSPDRPADAGSPVDGVVDTAAGFDSRSELLPADAGDPAVCGDGTGPACGGDLTGRWRHIEACQPSGPISRPQDCPTPWEQEPSCRGSGNTQSCRTLYEGTVEFTSGAQALLDLSVSVASTFTLSATCVDRLRSQGTPVDRCRALSTAALDCQVRAGVCECAGRTEPTPIGLNRFRYTTNGNQLQFDTGGTIAPGMYCVDGRRLSIRFAGQGFEGWSGWTLERRE
jgi:hypothetical protein